MSNAQLGRSGKNQLRRHITAHEKHLWAEMAQLLMLAGLAESSKWEAKDLVFHGGTSLHMGWASPRFSEDLDFLLNKDLLKEMSKTMVDVVKQMQRHLLRLDPGLRVELKDKSTSRMGRFNISLSKDGIIGKSMVKSEFWGVDDAYLQAYRATPRLPIIPQGMRDAQMVVRLRAQLPMATLDSVFCDKLVAMAGREYIKWRDIFDVWWISQSKDFKRPDDQMLAERIRFYSTAYRTDPNKATHDDGAADLSVEGAFETTLASRLRAYAQQLEGAQMKDAAREELSRFLSDVSGQSHVWARLWEPHLERMIAHAQSLALHTADLIESLDLSRENSK